MSCSINGCEKRVQARGWCANHYARWKKYGDAEAPLQRQPNVGNCSVEGCQEPSRKRGWCGSHYASWQKTGEQPKPFKYRWADSDGICLVCSEPIGSYLSRLVCSDNCKALYYRYKGEVPTTAVCNICNETYCLFTTSAGGRKKRTDSLTCSNCKRLSHLSVYVKPLRERDGDDCALCGTAIDFTLTYPNPGYRSVDHVIPWARGGKDELSNFQLSHIRCNSQRRDLNINEYKELIDCEL